MSQEQPQHLLTREYLKQHQKELQNVIVGSLEEMPERVIQFGEGNFLRAFVDWHFNEIVRKGLFKGKVVIVQPLETGMVPQLNEQQGVYTLLRRGIENGKPVEYTEVITVVSRGLNPYAQWGEYLKLAASPDMRFLVSNTTEAGISYHYVPKKEGVCPVTFPAKVAAFLYERFKKFEGAADKGLIIIPCELIKKNGEMLKRAVQHHAIDWELGIDFLIWLEKSNYFCSTLVDRIVPGYPKEEMPTITKRLGYVDKMLVTSEVFHLWAIQGNEIAKKELPFTDAGLNVAWTNDIQPFRTLKVRILNGMHTTFSITSFLAGNDTVLESLNDELVGKFISKALNEEILPSLDVADAEKNAFAGAVLERFRNPFIKHLLSSINLNSQSKYHVRVLPSVVSYYDKKKTLPPVQTFALAALISYFDATCEAQGYVGKRQKGVYAIADDLKVLEFFGQRTALYASNLEQLVRETLANTEFWERDLNAIPGFTEKVLGDLKNIQQYGMRGALERLLA